MRSLGGETVEKYRYVVDRRTHSDLILAKGGRACSHQKILQTNKPFSFI